MQRNIRVLVAIDKFKDTLPALPVCQAIHAGLVPHKAAHFQTLLYPLADGGEGFLECILSTQSAHWEFLEMQAHDPLA